MQGRGPPNCGSAAIPDRSLALNELADLPMVRAEIPVIINYSPYFFFHCLMGFACTDFR